MSTNSGVTSVVPAERPPFSFGMAPDWRLYSFDWQAGRPAVFVLAHSADWLALQPLLAALMAQRAAFQSRGADLLVLAGGASVTELRALLAASGLAIEVVDCGDEFLARCALPPGRSRVLVVDRNVRVALQEDLPEEPHGLAARCLACLDALPHEAGQAAVMPAPVLMLPLFPRKVCRGLIERFEAGGSVEGKVAAVDASGQPKSDVDSRVKRRRDLQIHRDDPLFPVLQGALLQRCAPEVEKAFQAKITHTDRLLIARYDAPDGWFRRHRDNTSPNTAFREFAISVNLNTDEYEGGCLTFPEYNDHRYRPPTGAGIVFSSSILHEAGAVTLGRRYALLTFFHGDAAEARRHLGRCPKPRERTVVLSTP